nr:ASKHA domain-containing protein [uncultured Acetatifactor sp.]
MVEVRVNGVIHYAEPGTLLGDLLTGERSGEAHFEGCAGSGGKLPGSPMLALPCGGHGRCGKCRVFARGALSPLSDAERRLLSQEDIDRGIRLACCTAAEGDCSVEMELLGNGQIRIAGDMPAILLKPSFRFYGFVLDIGTTTLAARLCDTSGKLLAEGSGLNPQAGWGADVISRIEADLRGEGPKLTQAICTAVDSLVMELSGKAKIAPKDIDGMAVTGNTVMLHLLTGTSTEPLSHAPFAAGRLFGETVTAESLGLASLRPEAAVYLAPCAAAFVGADLITAVLAGALCDTPGTRLLADIGTNGEMALWHEGALYCCSTAAGPAFEGAGISMGMGGSAGAVDRVAVTEGRLKAHVIGDAAAVGICGSGVVDAVACLLETGQLDDTGYLEEESAVICEPVTFTQNDVRMVQLAKSAIHAGIRTLLHTAGLECAQVESLLIAGGFGSYLDVGNAAKIGLFPEEMLPCIRVVGNAALSGASMLLLNEDYRAVCEKYARDAKLVELSSNPYFADEYMERMLF